MKYVAMTTAAAILGALVAQAVYAFDCRNRVVVEGQASFEQMVLKEVASIKRLLVEDAVREMERV